MALAVRAIVMMGVAGSGKTTNGMALAARLGWAFYDADDLHPPSNIAKLSAGLPLSDDDRWAWLDRVHGLIRYGMETNRPLVVACSALRAQHRTRIQRDLSGIAFVHLVADAELIRSRLAARKDHFVGPELLDSQLATLEPPQDALVVHVNADVATIVERIIAGLGLGAGNS